MSSNQKLNSELEEMLKELQDSDLSKLPEERILEMRKKLNPYGRTIEGSDKYLNFSITQIQHEYWKKLIISAFIGFLNRMNDEWKVPEGVPVVPVYDYLDDPTKVDTPKMVLEKGYKKTIDEYEFNKKWMEKRVIVKEFLEEMFQFNPEEHVRSAYRPCRADNTRKPINTPAGKLAVSHLKRKDKEFAATEELYGECDTLEVKSDDKSPCKSKSTVKSKSPCKSERKSKSKSDSKSENTINSKDESTRESANGVKSGSNNGRKGDGKDKKSNKVKKVRKMVTDPVTGKKKMVLKEVVIDDKLPADMKDDKCGKQTREFLPPHDMFGRFKMYLESNYEELRDFVRDAYCEKPEFELAINPYSVHDTLEEAETFKKKHRNEVIAEVFTVCFGKWCFFDCFKEQRENVNFYNDKTIILEEMMKQHKKDEMLGQDLLKKRVEKAKRKNIAEDGPDAESFRKYVSQNKDIQSMGAEYLGDKADDDVPDDAVQVDVWRIAKGGMEVTKDKFYSAAEAPTFVKEAHEKARIENGMGKKANVPPQNSRSDNL